MKTSIGRVSLFFVVALSLAASLAPHQAQAKLWRNAYVSFEMPDTWNCALEQTEWVCRSSDNKESREAIIILTAKEVGPMDTFEAYTQHLNTPQQVSYRNMGNSTSRVIYPPKRVNINDHPWIDGLHLGSEVPSYFTRYLATIKERIAVLVTFSAHRDHYAKYSSSFFNAVRSLRVIATKNLLSSPEMGPLRPSDGSMLSNINGAMPADIDGGELAIDDGGGGSSKLKNFLIGAMVLLAGIGLYIFLKSKKKG